ncbi:MAG: glycosyltransferase family 4 protein [candidate division KSB1 bacterium]|nr:glycosyltransferase family 4 protein [candidate division KSB1 bacterium]
MGRTNSILIYSENFYPRIGGAELQLWRLGRALATMGTQVTVVTLWNDRALPLREALEGMTIYRLPYPQRRVLDSLVVPWRLSAYLLQNARDFSVLHVQGIGLAGAVALIVSRLLGKQTCFAVMGSEELYVRESTRVPKPVLFKLYALAHHAVAINRQSRDYLIDRGIRAERIHVIPYGVDTTVFHPRRPSEEMTDPAVIFVGRLVPLKGLRYLLEGWPHVLRRVPGARLLMVGDGPFRPELEELARALDIEDSVQFLGAQRDVQRFLRLAEVAVLPSLSEGLPNSLLEAMACGLAVVASRLPGVSELIEDGKNGLLVEPGNTKALAEALITVLTNAPLRRALGARAAETVRREYSLERMVNAFASLYHLV